MSVFFTDTDCEMSYVDADALGMKVIGMPYTLKDQEYVYDFGRTFDAKKFYDQMRDGEIVTTSALNTQNYIDYFEPVLAAGEDILYVHFSRELSGTFNHMDVAIKELKAKYPDRKITCFDTRNICIGGGIQAIEACKLHNAGASDEEVVEFLKEFKDRVSMYFYVDSLQYLKRGGRISAVSAVMGSMLNIKPILGINEGKLEKLTTVKGTKKALDFIYNKFETEYADDERYDVYVLDADSKQIGDDLAEKIRNSGRKVNINRIFVGPVIGAHSGPGTVGVVFVKK
jgi:DegV family protein with EDD domain